MKAYNHLQITEVHNSSRETALGIFKHLLDTYQSYSAHESALPVHRFSKRKRAKRMQDKNDMAAP